MFDCLVLGGGIIGLSIADELAHHPAYVNRRIQVLDRKIMGRSASLAAAGVLPPASSAKHREPVEQLTALSHQLYPEWVERLSDRSGIDVEFRTCGALYLARQLGEASALRVAMMEKQAEGIQVEQLTKGELNQLDPELDTTAIRCAFKVADEYLVRPVRLIEALRESTARSRVEFAQTSEPITLSRNEGVCHALVGERRIEAETIIVAAGPWATDLLLPLGFDIGVEPIRGQMVMWKTDGRRIHHVINEGLRYVVGRDDGQIVAGATVEEVGFSCDTTEEGISELVAFGQNLLPILSTLEVAETWAGLRPASRDGRPSIGRTAGFKNLIVATGHYRAGIHLAPITANCVASLLLDESPPIDLEPFAPRRN